MSPLNCIVPNACRRWRTHDHDVCRWAELQAATGELGHSAGLSASPPARSLACSLTCTIRPQNAAWTRSPCPRAGEHARADPSTSALAPAEGFRQEPKPTFVRDAVMPLWHPSGPRCRNVSDSVWLRASSPSTIRDVSMWMAMGSNHTERCFPPAPLLLRKWLQWRSRVLGWLLPASEPPSSRLSGPRARPSPMHPDGRPHFAPLLRAAPPSDAPAPVLSGAAPRCRCSAPRRTEPRTRTIIPLALGPPPPCPLRRQAVLAT